MFLTPGLFILFDKVIYPRFQVKTNQREQDSIDDEGTVIIAGIGRFGQVVNRFLISNNIKTVVLDYQVSQVDTIRRINTKAYYGDATRPDLLKTAGIEEASLFVVAIDNREDSVELVKYLHHSYPKLKIVARAFDRGHGHLLKGRGRCG
ncbi:NAD-binding protein [Paucibacter sp. O1-1]|nr:NAD-binding protein [Paucibacter sp. O1-1]MDA3831352.1 NAD-binding protein [Paucibacter sp. O1-1]